ncbi:MAG: long-chain fatty acid--CoA ligase, partial [Nitrospirae bacterium]|nr:long-chain fatty acid--CoA ligase [Nitrospirota bacterium]
MRDEGVFFPFPLAGAYVILLAMKKEILPLDQMLGEQAQRIPRKTFVKFEGRKYSYREMDRLASVFASFLLEQGLRRGDRIALLSCNCY